MFELSDSKFKSVLEIKEVKDLASKTEMEIEVGDSFQIQNDKLIIYKIKNIEKQVKTELENQLTGEVSEQEKEEKEEEKTQRREQKDFAKKWQIRTGAHLLHSTEGMMSYNLKDENYFETTTAKKIIRYFNLFYNKLDVIQKYKRSKRSYLLHSDPGMGKSALLRHLSKQALQNPGVAVITTSGDVDFNMLTQIFLRPYHSDVKMILLFIEDMGRRDFTNNTNYYNGGCLNFLDGQESLFRVPTLIIATTNFAKELGPQFTNRPGRFNKVIKVNPPADDEVFELIEGFAKITLTDEQKQVLRNKDLTPDHCIEIILRSEIEDISISEAVEEIKKEREGIINFDKP